MVRSVLWRAMDIDEPVRTDPLRCSVSDRLRWASDFLDLAGKAVSMIACVQGPAYPPDLHREAQQDLRAWARCLDERPSVSDFE
jgi:hypothetical protein